MAVRGPGRPTIQKLIISLLVIGAIACGAVYVALTAGPVPVKRADNRPPTRTLAYEQRINGADQSAPAPQESAPAPEPEQQAAVPQPEPIDPPR